MIRWMISVIILAGLVACSSTGGARPPVALPVLKLPPSSLPQPLFLQQQLGFRFGQQTRQMTALLESDENSVRLAAHAMGQTGVRLTWDGVRLEQKRARWLPSAVCAERVLDDLQFVYWPEDVISRVLPTGWHLHQFNGGRALQLQGATWLESVSQDDGSIVLTNHADGYVLHIQSFELDGTRSP